MLKDTLVFGDITTGRIWYADRAALLAADDDPETLAPIHEMDSGIRGLAEQAYRARGGKGETLPGASQISGRGRVDLRFAVDDAGELYILAKPDGMIRKVVGASVVTTPAVTSAAPAAATPGPAPLPTVGPGTNPGVSTLLMSPGFSGALSDADMWNIVNYLRHLSNTRATSRLLDVPPCEGWCAVKIRRPCRAAGIASVVPDTLKLRHRDMRDMCVGAAVLTGLSARSRARHLTAVRLRRCERFGCHPDDDRGETCS